MAFAAPSRKDDRTCAVIRCYKPSRIERELLAQAFDLAEHIVRSGLEGWEKPSSNEDRGPQPTTSKPFSSELQQPSSYVDAEAMEALS